jgi:hypothetical protein
MPDYVIQPAADHTADPGDFSNAIYAGGIASPGDANGLTNGTAYVARQLSPVSAEFTPVAAASFGGTYTGAVTVAAPAADPTSATLPIGAANANRWVVFAVHAFLSGNTTDKIAGVTLNGSACDILVRSGGVGTGQHIVFICMTQSPVATGETATVQVDWVDGFGPNSSIAVQFHGYRVLSSGAPVVADTDSQNNSALSLDVEVGDVLISSLMSTNQTDPSASWTGATHRNSIDLATGEWASVADDLAVASAATGRSVSNTTPARYAGIVLRAPA